MSKNETAETVETVVAKTTRKRRTPEEILAAEEAKIQKLKEKMLSMREDTVTKKRSKRDELATKRDEITAEIEQLSAEIELFELQHEQLKNKLA